MIYDYQNQYEYENYLFSYQIIISNYVNLKFQCYQIKFIDHASFYTFISLWISECTIFHSEKKNRLIATICTYISYWYSLFRSAGTDLKNKHDWIAAFFSFVTASPWDFLIMTKKDHRILKFLIWPKNGHCRLHPCIWPKIPL